MSQAPPFEDSIYGGGEPAFQSPFSQDPDFRSGIFAPSPPRSEEEEEEGLSELTPEERAQRFRESASQHLGIDDEFGEQDALGYLESLGLDTSHPDMQAFLQEPGNLEMLLSPEGSFLVPVLLEKYPKGTSSYHQALRAFGFDVGVGSLDFAPAPGAAQLGRLEKLPGLAEGKDYVINQDTGGIMFRDGTILDSATQQIFFPLDPDVPGSPLWYEQVQKNPSSIAQWRKRLVQFGYLPKDAEKGGWDVQLRQALDLYHQNRYLNLGKPIPAGNIGLGQEVQDMKVIRGQIQNEVREQFRRVFGDDPTPAELDEWSSFVMKKGMQLQRQGLSFGEAAVEAGERFIGRLEQTPQAIYERETVQENTELHDALVNAVLATRGLMS